MTFSNVLSDSNSYGISFMTDPKLTNPKLTLPVSLLMFIFLYYYILLFLNWIVLIWSLNNFLTSMEIPNETHTSEYSSQHPQIEK